MEKQLCAVNEIKIVYKNEVDFTKLPQIITSKHAYDIFKESWNMDTISLFEEFKVLYLNRDNRVLAIYSSTIGNECGIVINKKLIFAAGLQLNAACIILAHNHPSGALKPSRLDTERTREMQIVGKALEMEIFDHIIVTPNGFFSFADSGLL